MLTDKEQTYLRSIALDEDVPSEHQIHGILKRLGWQSLSDQLKGFEDRNNLYINPSNNNLTQPIDFNREYKERGFIDKNSKLINNAFLIFMGSIIASVIIYGIYCVIVASPFI